MSILLKYGPRNTKGSGYDVELRHVSLITLMVTMHEMVGGEVKDVAPVLAGGDSGESVVSCNAFAALIQNGTRLFDVWVS